MTRNRLLLLDWDDTVSDREMVRTMQRERSIAVLGAEKAAMLWGRYDEVRKSGQNKIQVDQFISMYEKESNTPVRDVFYGIDFSRCVDREGWNQLRCRVDEADVDIKIFSEGSPEYQLHKIQRSGLDLGLGTFALHKDKVFIDKVRAFSGNVWQDIKDMGYKDIWYADDKKHYLDSVFRISGGTVKCILMDMKNEFHGELTPNLHVVHSLGEVGDVIGKKYMGIEGVRGGGER